MAESTQIDVEPEVLRMQMEESREALAHKIEMLEEKVTDTVQNATASVAEATANVLETVQTATASVTETVDSVTSAVQGTVDNVRHSVEGTVDSVKGAFDISSQVAQHPWLMMGGAVAIGFLGGTFVGGGGGSSAPASPRKNTSPKSATAQTESVPVASYQPAYAASLPMCAPSSVETTNGAKSESAGSDWLHHLGATFGSEIGKLQSLAVGAALGAARDMIVEAAPPAIQKELQGVIDSFTEKLGGQAFPSHAFTPPASK